MNNPWNVKMETNFNEEIKKEIVIWYNEIVSFNSHLRKNKIIENPLNEKYKKYIKKIYDEGYGFKIIARWLDLSYMRTRTLIITYLKIETRKGYKVSTRITRKFRSDRVKGNKSPWYNWPETMPYLVKGSRTGIQGYYLNKKGKYIWLRSTWEYIYAKWLDNKKILWEYEAKTYKLSNGETYRPDFKIIEKDNYYLVEIKGSRFKDRLYKVDLFKKEYSHIKIIVIKDISAYSEIGYKKELKEWKTIKLSKKELKKLQ